jgi:hypothetical protein
MVKVDETAEWMARKMDIGMVDMMVETMVE